MSNINNLIRNITNYHIDTKFLFTPIAIAVYDVHSIRVKMIYVFGIRIIRAWVKP